jgi:hypothetical protein
LLWQDFGINSKPERRGTKMTSRNYLFAAICIAAAATASAANFDTYLGKIPTFPTPVPIAGDADGHLYYGTVTGPNSGLYVIEDPASAIGQADPEGTTVSLLAEFGTGRGPQGIQVTTSGTVFVSGDTGSAPVYIRKFNRTANTPLTFSEDTTFHTNAQTYLPSNRIGGCAIISEAGDGLIVGQTFNSLNFFKFDGTGTGLTNVYGGSARIYEREPVYNSRDNVVYSMKNGNLQSTIVDGYYGGMTPEAGGGTFTEASLIADGAVNSQFGSSTQNGYFDSDTNQLITCDTIPNDSGTTQIRVWNVSPGGAALTLAYAIDSSLGGAGWSNLGDAVVINNKLYVTSFGANAIYVYGTSTLVDDWKRFSSK